VAYKTSVDIPQVEAINQSINQSINQCKLDGAYRGILHGNSLYLLFPYTHKLVEDVCKWLPLPPNIRTIIS